VVYRSFNRQTEKRMNNKRQQTCLVNDVIFCVTNDT
jgi:hypothetical protein